MRLVLTFFALAAAQADAAVVDRFFVIMFENHGYNQVLANSYWQRAIAQGMLITNYRAISHPSQPNYIATIAGDLLACPADNKFDTNARQLTDTLDEKRITWRTYQEDYPPLAGGNCNPIMSIGPYYRKHNPFMSFTQISGNSTKCQDIVNEKQLSLDLAAGRLKQFVYYTPNINNDSHDQSLDFSGQYFLAWLDKYTKEGLFKNNTYMLMTFDEDEGLEGNRVATALYGAGITPGTKDDGKIAYTHYSIPKTAQDIWGVASLGRGDVAAQSLLKAIPTAQPNDLIPHWEKEWQRMSVN
jgi:hypothetical protein